MADEQQNSGIIRRLVEMFTDSPTALNAADSLAGGMTTAALLNPLTNGIINTARSVAQNPAIGNGVPANITSLGLMSPPADIPGPTPQALALRDAQNNKAFSNPALNKPH